MIKRTEKYEIEKIGKKKVKLQVKWIDDCSYRLVFIKGNKAFWAGRPKSASTPDLIVRILETDDMSFTQESRFEGDEEFSYRSQFFVVN